MSLPYPENPFVGNYSDNLLSTDDHLPTVNKPPFVILFAVTQVRLMLFYFY